MTARILIVDDEPLNVEVAAIVCETMGFAVTGVSDGVDAIRLLEESLASGEAFDLLLTDVLMPIVDGLELTRYVRRRDGLAALPIVGMTAKASARDIQRCLDAGMSVVLSKPFRASVIREAVTQALALAAPPVA